MPNMLTLLARILLAQVFLVQVIMLTKGFNVPDGYHQYELSLGALGLPGIFAPLIILVQFVGGLALLLGYKTKFFALLLAIYALVVSFLLPVSVLNYLAIAGGLLLLWVHPNTAFSLDNLRKK
ncbi:MAG: DoxX family protein [Methylophilaceae bacterium]